MARSLLQIAGLMTKLGIIGFGGPAAHIAMLEEEVVERRKWMTRERFLDTVGATNLIPGPNSTEMAMHVGYHQAGWLGLLIAGTCFVGPAVLITAAFAWLYVRFGQLPQVAPILQGIKPAVLAIIAAAGWRLGKKAIKNSLLAGLMVASTAAALWFVGYEIQVLLAVSVVGLLLIRFLNTRAENDRVASVVALFAWQTAAEIEAKATSPEIWRLGLFFLKVGAVLYGSGYVLFAYLEGGLVNDLGWLTREQLLDAVAIGQFTPGPILSTATFIGYVVMCPSAEGSVGLGLQGAAVASLAIFLPSFVFVAILGPIVPRLRKNVWAAAFLDAVNAASIGLMAAVTLRLAMEVFFVTPAESPGWVAIRWWAVLIAGAAGIAVFRWKVNAAWVVLGGAIAGWLLYLPGNLG